MGVERSIATLVEQVTRLRRQMAAGRKTDEPIHSGSTPNSTARERTRPHGTLRILQGNRNTVAFRHAVLEHEGRDNLAG